MTIKAIQSGYRPPQQQKKQEESPLDFFKDTWNKREAFANDTKTVTTEDYLKRLSVKNRDYTIPTVRNVSNDFSKIVRSEDVKQIKLIGDYSVIDLPIEASIRTESFYAPGGDKIAFKSITKVEEIEASKYSSDATFQLKANGFTKFYQLYKKSDFNQNVDVKLCRMATR